MDFKITEKSNPLAKHYSTEDLDTAREFAKKVMKEFGSFVKSVVLFGSSARKLAAHNPHIKRNDIDILVVINDLTITLSSEVVETYRVIMERLVSETNKQIHLTTLKMTNFYEYLRTGDPIVINILRDGVAIVDTGFFDPVQALLYMGKIRPTYEAIWTYMNRAPNTLFNSNWHILQGTLDLYWATIDAAHAALMRVGQIPPSPQQVSQMIKDILVKNHKVPVKYSKTMSKLYSLSRKIVDGSLREIKGADYDKYKSEATAFVNYMKKFVESHSPKK